MRHLTAIALFLFALTSSSAHAKRIAAPKVEPVVHEGVRYVAPNDNGRRAYIQAWGANTNRMLWSATLFRTFINPLLEEDVQWVFIKTLSVADGKLVATDERGRSYSVDLKTQAVKKLKRRPDK